MRRDGGLLADVAEHPVVAFQLVLDGRELVDEGALEAVVSEESRHPDRLDRIAVRGFEDQREILAKTSGRDPATVPQLWALYKEVQEYYDRCGAMDRTRARFKKMREILSALPDEDDPGTAA